MPDLQAIRNPVQSELTECDKLIQSQLGDKQPLLRNIITHIIKAGGKRLRPLLCLLCARACEDQNTEATNHEAVTYATVIEFIHTATLLHDDVVDHAELRRGIEAANQIWGNHASILVGDFLYSRAFQMMADLKHADIMQIMANVTNRMSIGEINQLDQIGNPSLDREHYFDTIERKTAGLFSAAAEIGARLATKTNDADQQQDDDDDNLNNNEKHTKQINACNKLGHHIGMAYQIIDDTLDYADQNNTLGKQLGDDLAEHKYTLPLILTLEKLNPDERNQLNSWVEAGRERLPEITQTLRATNAFAQCIELANQHCETARDACMLLPESHTRTAIIKLIEMIQLRAQLACSKQKDTAQVK